MSRKFIRVEVYDKENHTTLGGYKCALLGELAFAKSKMATNRSVSSTDDVQTLNKILAELSEIPEVNGLRLPEYNADKYVSFLKPCVYDDKLDSFIELENYIRKKDRDVKLIRKDFTIADQDIIHEDYYQVVVTKERYDALNQGVTFEEI